MYEQNETFLEITKMSSLKKVLQIKNSAEEREVSQTKKYGEIVLKRKQELSDDESRAVYSSWSLLYVMWFSSHYEENVSDT